MSFTRFTNSLTYDKYKITIENYYSSTIAVVKNLYKYEWLEKYKITMVQCVKSLVNEIVAIKFPSLESVRMQF
jgi:hypothetical protein